MDVELDYKESWERKNWCFWTVVLEKTLESPLDCKESKPVNPKENQSWIFIEMTYAEAETPVLWPPDAKNWFVGKDPDTGKYWLRGEKGMTEDEKVGWASPTQWTWVWVNSRSWWCIGRLSMLQSMDSQSDMSELLNWTELISQLIYKVCWRGIHKNTRLLSMNFFN